MAGNCGELRGTTKPDGDSVWNGFGMIESLIVYLETQINNWLICFDPKNIQI